MQTTPQIGNNPVSDRAGRVMAKNLIVCCDGTANEFTRDRTNVVKLFYTLIKDPIAQAVFYHPGVGTMAAPGFVTKRAARKERRIVPQGVV